MDLKLSLTRKLMIVRQSLFQLGHFERTSIFINHMRCIVSEIKKIDWKLLDVTDLNLSTDLSDPVQIDLVPSRSPLRKSFSLVHRNALSFWSSHVFSFPFSQRCFAFLIKLFVCPRLSIVNSLASRDTFRRNLVLFPFEQKADRFMS